MQLLLYDISYYKTYQIQHQTPPEMLVITSTAYRQRLELTHPFTFDVGLYKSNSVHEKYKQHDRLTRCCLIDCPDSIMGGTMTGQHYCEILCTCTTIKMWTRTVYKHICEIVKLCLHHVRDPSAAAGCRLRWWPCCCHINDII